MKERAADEETIRRYILNSLSQEELKEIEYRLLTDAEYLEKVSLLEDKLVDDYVCEVLSQEERRQFEGSYLSTPEGQTQVRFAARLRQYALIHGPAPITEAATAAGSAPSRETSRLGHLLSTLLTPRYVMVGAAALSLVLAIGAAIALWSLKRSHVAQPGPSPDAGELRAQLSEQQRQNEELSARLRTEQEKRLAAERELVDIEQVNRVQAASALSKIVLLPGRERGAASESKLIIGPGVSRVSLYLLLRDSNHDRFKVSVQNENEQEVWGSDSLAARGSGRRKGIQLTLPSSVLLDGDYVVKLQGASGGAESAEVDYYYFRVVKR